MAGHNSTVASNGANLDEILSKANDLATFMANVKTVSTLAGLPGDSHSIIANVSAATNFSMTAPVAGREVMVRVNNTSSSAITQALPTTGVYQSMAGSSVSIPANGFIELSIWSIGGMLVIRVGENA